MGSTMRNPVSRCHLLAVALLGLAAGLPAARASDWFGMGREREIKLGREVAALVEQSLPMSQDPVAIAKVRAIGQRLVSVSGEPDWPWEFHVIADPEVNAFCLPGGFIYVYEGLLQAMPDDDALAFVIAHEMTHATKRHFVSQLKKARLLSVLTLGWGDLLNIFLQPNYSRQDEYSADEVGLAYAVRAGYSADGGAEAMAALLTLIGTGRSGIAMFRSHPPTDARVARLKDEATQIRAEGAERVYETLKAAEVGREPSPVGDLSAYQLAPNAALPLAVGAKWRYQVRGSGPGYLRSEVQVLEQVPGDTAGVFRVRTTIEGITHTSLMAAATDGLLQLLDPTDPRDAWAIEWQLPTAEPVPNPYFHIVGPEQVAVPYGAVQAVKVQKLDEGGKVLESAWFADGLGLVRRECPSLGITEVLESYEPPRP